ncbi:MAG TPA: type II toxin-antitoxin system VapC family toxin [Fimbriiglobus sp.]|jgi:PIN domain nuclease of toxin-antitoxin system
MELLLDTHVFLWLIEGNSNLSLPAKKALNDPLNELVLSAASIWERAIKIGNGKLSLNDPLDVFVTKWVAIYQLDPLPILPNHALAIVGMPDHHRDPFDRLLIAQATIEGLTLTTADKKTAAYGVPFLW